jgi:PPK2 family polyphosphate:nucleotide phosphotransferase
MGAPSTPLSSLLIAQGGHDLVLAGLDPSMTVIGKADAKDELRQSLRPRLFDLHELMMANEDHGVLLVLQGLDCSGKNGTIKHVISAMNPAAVRVASFTEPEGDEREEHFLERIRRQVPHPGELVVFDRSHYEDVLVPAVHDGMSGDEFDSRLDEIVEFEAGLARDGITVVKCFLHISYDEQRERLLRRLRRRDKWWKFSESDLDTRRKWAEFDVVYGKAIARSSTEAAPWFVIPADHKWHRNWAIASLLVEYFERFGEQYPELDTKSDVETLRAQLAPPN